ncbi:capsular biosynthesis protein [Lachnospiraceae bacterium 62-35]
MRKITLVIPSATLVPEELQNLGKLPAIIYPINQKMVFDYLYEQYKGDCSRIKILLYKNADKVRRRLAKFEKNGVELENIPELSDLGHTVYYGIDKVEGSIIINFADTIVTEDNSSLAENCIYYAEDFVSETWTYFKESNGIITDIYDKTILDIKSEEKEKLFVGVFKLSDARYFKACLEKSFQGYEEGISTFYYALKLYSQKYPLCIIKSVNWFDIGHADKYYNSKLEVRAREFNHITVDKDRGILRKSSEDRDKFIGEIKWYLKLPSDVEYVRPRIFDYSTSYNDPFVSMEYYAYHTVHELFLYGDLTCQQWIDIFKRIRFLCNDFKRYTVKDKNIIPALKDMYLNKTFQRFSKMRQDKRLIPFFNNPVTVNSIQYKSLNDISKALEKIIPKLLYDIKKFNIIHGDLCFANIMVDGNFSFIKVVDPRGKFGSYDIYGDRRYELAKLFHSVDGKYDFIIKDLFDIEYDTDCAVIEYRISNRKRKYDLYKVFCEVFKEEIGPDLKKIELIEALLFLSMIPLHNESFEHQLAMLGIGLEILSRVIDIEECKGVK